MLSTQILTALQSHGTPENRAGMSRFGINTANAYGVSMGVIRSMAKSYKKNHSLALDLWNTGIHEARILAALIDDPKLVTETQMESWVQDFNSWDLCDQTCGNLFDKTPYAFDKAAEWSFREEEFIKRAGFVLMAWLAVHAKKTPDESFLPFFKHLEREAKDKRNFVKKAVNWALRQIGKRSRYLREEAILIARLIREQPYSSARWIAADALRELEKVKITA
ncbi:DNA alkylation repair protein [Rhodocytophaga rosea]|uniref:DNA alkylation repair protein n=1 Tax=Rhodocytophaga rosea TaxID=2704465 RepID=A0A6C0GJ76_9BACT|nr:DNA alkylation repair protein [Rhodocytophaga rosea]QHT67999.1 DNA alkylation repair protein [Rhodocytophaga rosea]